MITVHHLDHSRSQRILWLLEELCIDYEVRYWKRDPATLLAPVKLRDIHPLGKAPIVVDGDDVLAESGLIVESLVERYDVEKALAPPIDSGDRQRYRYWMHYAEGSAMPPLLLKLVFDRIRSSRMPFFVRPIARMIADRTEAAFIGPQLKLHLDWMEAEVARKGWFAGDRFSAADIQMSYPVEAAAQRVGFGASRSALADWLARVQARPAYQRALQRGGRFDHG